LYHGIWIDIVPNLLLKNNNIEFWRSYLSDEVNSILRNISSYIPSINKFNLISINTVVPISFSTLEESRDYYDLMLKSLDSGIYAIGDISYPQNKNLEIIEKKSGIMLSQSNHNIIIEHSKLQVNFGVKFNYKKIYPVQPKGVKKLNNYLKYIGPYTFGIIIIKFSRLFKADYKDRPNFLNRLDAVNIIDEIEKLILVPLEETNIMTYIYNKFFKSLYEN
jgi:hypothetical protein